MSIKRFTFSLLDNSEKVIRWLIFIIVATMMLFLVLNSLYAFYSTYSLSPEQFVSSSVQLEKHLTAWKAYRNLTYLLLTINLPLAIFRVVHDATIKEKEKDSYKPILYWFGLLLLVTFSYALAGLVIDLVMLAFTFHESIINNTSNNAN